MEDAVRGLADALLAEQLGPDPRHVDSSDTEALRVALRRVPPDFLDRVLAL